MKIELKDIQISERKSEETFAFDAELYINDYKAGKTFNYGNGGITAYRGYDAKGRKLIKDAERWCNNLPPEVLTYKGRAVENPMSLDRYIDNIVQDYHNKHAIAEFEKKFEREMKSGIVFGVAGKYFNVLRFANPIEKILQFKHGEDYLKKAVHRVQSSLKPGERILNTNIPASVLKLVPTNIIGESKNPLMKALKRDAQPRILKEVSKKKGRRK